MDKYDWSQPLPSEHEQNERMHRVSGECICAICGLQYRKHPHDMRFLDWNDEPFLRQLCDGRWGKL